MNNEICLCTALRQAAHEFTSYYDQVLAPSGLKVTMYRLLKNLHEMDSPSISQLAERMRLDRSTLGRNIKILPREGLVRLVSSDDERQRRIVLTTGGSSSLKLARPLWIKAKEQMARKLGNRSAELLSILDDLKREH